MLKIKKIPSAHFEQRGSFAASRPSPADPILHFFIIFSEHIHSLADSFLLGKEKSTSNEKSLLALLTCHLLIVYRYGITACIPHVKNHTNDTLKLHRSGVPRSTDTEKRLAFSPTDKWNKFAFSLEYGIIITKQFSPHMWE